MRSDDAIAVLAPTLTSMTKRELRSASVAIWLFLEPLNKSLSQWPGMARTSTSAGLSRINTQDKVANFRGEPGRFCPMPLAA